MPPVQCGIKAQRLFQFRFRSVFLPDRHKDGGRMQPDLSLTRLEPYGVLKQPRSHDVIAEQVFDPTECIEDAARTRGKTNGPSRKRQRLVRPVVTYREGEGKIVQSDDIRRLHLQNAPVTGYG